MIFQQLFEPVSSTYTYVLGAALLGGAVVATAAYVTDYHLVPKRSTPGWESRVSRRSIAAAYVVLALSLPLRGLLGK